MAMNPGGRQQDRANRNMLVLGSGHSRSKNALHCGTLTGLVLASMGAFFST